MLLLQMAIALLATPNMTPTQQAQATQFANQAVQLASIALQTNPTSTLSDIVTTSTPPIAPVIPTTTAIGGADLNSVVTPPATPPPVPSCTLSESIDSATQNPIFSWTTQNVDPSAVGTILVGNWYGTGEQTLEFRYRNITAYPFANKDGGVGQNGDFLNSVSPKSDVSYKLEIGGATCVVPNGFCAHGGGDPRLANYGISDKCTVPN